METHVVILGAGPSGLACALKLSEHNQPATLIEKESAVGGLCRTIKYKNYLFDIGGHRFFSRRPEIIALWNKILGSNFQIHYRNSKILFQNKLYNYPVEIGDAFYNLGFKESISIVLSLLKERLCFKKKDNNLRAELTKRFGTKLFNCFYKSYTEKTWELPCEKLDSDLAFEKIGFLKFKTTPEQNRFYYPALGPGMMYDEIGNLIIKKNNNVFTEHQIIKIKHKNFKIASVVCQKNNGEKIEIHGSHFISSLPLNYLIYCLDPPLPAEIRELTKKLKFRHHLMVNLILDEKNAFAEQWIYVNIPNILIIRIQNFNNWSGEFVPNQSKTSLGIEYICSDEHPLWNTNDKHILSLSLSELKKISLIDTRKIIDYRIAKTADAYPLYYLNYSEDVKNINSYLKSFKNLFLIGRGGEYKYIHMDLAMISGQQAATKILL